MLTLRLYEILCTVLEGFLLSFADLLTDQIRAWLGFGEEEP